MVLPTINSNFIYDGDSIIGVKPLNQGEIQNQNYNQQHSYQKQSYEKVSTIPLLSGESMSFVKPRKLFDVNKDTLRGLDNNKTQIYNKNFRNKKDYLSKNGSKNSRFKYRKPNGRIQRKRLSLVIRNSHGITHDRIIENILEKFKDYKVIYIIVSYEGNSFYINNNGKSSTSSSNSSSNDDINDVNNSYFNKNRITDSRITDSSITSGITNGITNEKNLNSYKDSLNFDLHGNNTQGSNSTNSTNKHSTNKDSTIKDDKNKFLLNPNDLMYVDNHSNMIVDDHTIVNNLLSNDNVSPHFHVLFKTKRVVDLNTMDIFRELSMNENHQLGSTFIVKSNQKDITNEISYITKDNNVKTWGEVPIPKQPKVKVGDDVATRLMNGENIYDIIEKRPGYALMNLKKIKEFQTEYELMKVMKNVKLWNMLLIDINGFNESELKIFDWLLYNLPVILLSNERALRPISTPQLYIYGGVAAGKSSLCSALSSRLPSYDFNENDHHNFYNDDLVWIILKDEFKGGSVPIYKINQFLDGQSTTLNTKGSVIYKKRNQPFIFLSNYHIFRIYDKAIEKNPMIRAQLKKRLNFVDLGVYRISQEDFDEEFSENILTDNLDLDGKSIRNLFKLIDSINNMDDQSYNVCTEHFMSAYNNKTMLDILWDDKKLTDYTLSRYVKYIYDDCLKKNEIIPNVYIELIKRVDQPYCKKLYDFIISSKNELRNSMNETLKNDKTTLSHKVESKNEPLEINNSDNNSEFDCETDSDTEKDTMLIDNENSHSLNNDILGNNTTTTISNHPSSSPLLRSTSSFIPNLLFMNNQSITINSKNSIQDNLQVKNTSTTTTTTTKEITSNNNNTLNFTVDDDDLSSL